MNEEEKRHQQRMQKKKALIDAKVAKATEERGVLIVLSGPGKGKSSSGFGTVIRCIGHGYKAAVVQFIKGTWVTGEAEMLRNRFAGECRFFVSGEGFTWDTQDRDRDIAAARAAWQVSCEMLTSGDYDLVILDELNIVLRYEYLSVDEVLAGLTARDPRTTVVVTGRDAPPALLEVADLVTEMTNVKHPFDAGIKAARGFDF